MEPVCQCPACTKPKDADYGAPLHGERGWKCPECKQETLPENFDSHAALCK